MLVLVLVMLLLLLVMQGEHEDGRGWEDWSEHASAGTERRGGRREERRGKWGREEKERTEVLRDN